MPTEPLSQGLGRVREGLLSPDTLLRAVASGRQRAAQPRWRRVELRYVDLKAGRHLQVTAYDATQAFTANHPVGEAAREAVEELLGEPFGNWHLDTAQRSVQLRVTKKGDAVVSVQDRVEQLEASRGHDRDKDRLLPADDPVYRALGIADEHGRIKPSRQAKLRQVEEFLRLLDTAVSDALEKGHLRRPTDDDPLRLADLGCGNAYLTFTAQRYLSHVRELPVRVVGVDVKEQSRQHNTEVAATLGEALGHHRAEFVVGTIAEATVDPAPEVVLALHACDTATDEALARAIGWEAPVVLAAPCCHHDIAAQLRKTPTPAPFAQVTRHGILRERLADTLTDALRASLLRIQGYRVDVVQFVESQHTPRNTMLRAVRTGSPVKGGSVRKEYDELVEAWAIRPMLAELLEARQG